MVQYILEVITFQLVFLVIYDFWLKRETFFQWNRVYLIGTYILSMVLPWVKIEALKTAVPEEYYVYPEFFWKANDMTLSAVNETEAKGVSISWEYVLLFGGMVLASLFFANKLRQLVLLRTKGEILRFTNFTQIIIANSQAAFSFFKTIFIGDKVLQGDYQNVIAHELVHIKQRHTYDLLFFELLRIVFWFNPLVYVYQNRVAELHEFIADAQVAKTNKKEHYQLLLSRVFETQNISFVNQFFKSSLIKKRIVMLQKAKSKKIWQLKYLLLVPMVLGMLAYTSSEKETNNSDVAFSIANDGDKVLIAEIRKALETEIEELINDKKILFQKGGMGSLDDRTKAIFYIRNKLRSEPKSGIVFSKREYFKVEIVTKLFFEGISRNLSLNEGKTDDFHEKLSWPSTERYQNYVSRKEAFYILDSNLQFSINGTEQKVMAIDVSPTYRTASLVFEVKNVKDLTGKEMLDFNHKMSAIFEKGNSIYDELILTDRSYAFRIYSGLPPLNLDVISTGDFDGQVTRTDNKITLIVQSLRKMTPGEKEHERALFEEVKNSVGIDTLLVTDGIASQQTVSQKDGIDIRFGKLNTDPVPFGVVDEIPVFPGCENAENKRECYQKSMQLHISKHFKYPKEALDKGIQGRVNIMFMMDEEGVISDIRKRGSDPVLEAEAERIIKLLPQMKPGRHEGKKVKVPFSMPIVFKLDDNVTGDGPNLKKDDAVPFAVIEEVPVFPGCEDAEDKRACFLKSMQTHISDNFKYPEEAVEKGIQGRVSTMFTISKDGSVQNIRMRGPDEQLEKEAQRIMRLLPVMKPGKSKGKKVDVPFSIPITFKLGGEKLRNKTVNLTAIDGMIPLYFVNGKETSKEVIESLNKERIESIHILKDEIAVQKYGSRAQNGVVEIILKKKE